LKQRKLALLHRKRDHPAASTARWAMTLMRLARRETTTFRLFLRRCEMR
jgi:hypothetical protein